MELEKWHYFNNGISAGRITRKKLRFRNIRGILNIVDEIHNLNSDEYLVISINQDIFPFSEGWEMTSRDFKKGGNQFNLSLGTKEEMIRDKVTPQQRICDIIAREFDGVKLLEERSYWDVLANREIYNQICRRGFKWNRRGSMLHTLMPQRDLSRGWRLASLVINEDMNLRFSNPGEIFLIEIPTTKGNPDIVRYAVKLYNFATRYPDAYGDWQMLDGQVSSSEEFEKAMRGIDMYSPASRRYKIQEFRLNFQLIAAAILRQHYNDDRMHQGKFSNGKRVPDQEIEPVKLNVPIPLTERRIGLDWKLDNNVVLEYRTKTEGGDEEVKVKKLNVGERELILSLDTYLDHIIGESPYIMDEGLNGLDDYVKMHKRVIGF